MKKYLPLLLLFGFLFFIPHAHAAITFDSSSTAGGCTTCTTVTTTFSVGAGTNELFLVCAAGPLGPAGNSTTTVNGVQMTAITGLKNANSRYAWMWYATGLSGTLNVSSTFANSFTSLNHLIYASYFGVNQSTPLETSTLVSQTSVVSNPSASVTTAVLNDLLQDCWGENNSNNTLNSPQIPLFLGGSNSAVSSYKVVSGSGSETMGFNTNGGTTNYVGIVAAFEPAGGAIINYDPFMLADNF